MAKKILKVKTTLAPLPALLVTCQDREGNSNIITISYAGVVNADPPMIYISVRPPRHSYNMIKESGEFVINIPGENVLKETDYCGIVSGSKVDKFQATGFTAIPAAKVKAPLIKECPVNLECMVKNVIPLGSHDLFLSEVVAVQADEDVLHPDDKVDIEKVKPFSFCYDSMQYWSLKERIGAYGFTKGKL
ncbi:MAG: flavin reductase family protein [Thermodesulfobacteriota bacterium]